MYFCLKVYRELYTSSVNPKSQAILQQIARIQRIDRGKLTVLRYGPNGPYYSHQSWENGKNVCRYVPADQVGALEQALEGYQQFQRLAAEYAEEIIARTRTELRDDSKKKLQSDLALAQNTEILELIARCQAGPQDGAGAQQWEILLRAALFKPTTELIGFLCQQAADRIDAAYPPRPGEHRKGRQTRDVQSLFGKFVLERDYYYSPEN